MKAISLVRLRHILAVARIGNFSLAAQEEGISQPALSRSIQAFEAEYDVRLFDRSRGGVALTPAGELAVEQARLTLAAASAMDRNMQLFRTGQTGRIGIGLGPLLASVLLPEISSRLLRSSPQLQIVSRISAADQLLDDLLDGHIEAIMGNQWHLSQIPGVDRVPLGRLRLVMAVREGHPAAQGGPVSMADLAAYPLATAFEQAHGMRQGGAFVCDNFHILRETTLATDCVWLTAPALARRDEAGGLVLLEVSDLPNETIEIWLATRRNRMSSPALGDIISIAREFLESLPDSSA